MHRDFEFGKRRDNKSRASDIRIAGHSRSGWGCTVGTASIATIRGGKSVQLVNPKIKEGPVSRFAGGGALLLSERVNWQSLPTLARRTHKSSLGTQVTLNERHMVPE